jgi:hypothetical protein
MRKIFIAHELLDLASCNPVDLLWGFFFFFFGGVFFSVMIAVLFCQCTICCICEKIAYSF